MNMGPVDVSVITIAPEKAVLSVELPGRVSLVREAEVRARVTGILLKRLFDEGAEVRAGQVLFEIDPAPLQASYDSAKANHAKAEASREQAQAKARRNEILIKSNGVSQQAYEDAKAAALQSEADVLAAKAALDSAALDLGYTKVTAPISGRIGKALVTEGALASASEATKMAVIRQLDPIYADFTQSSSEMLKLRRSLESGRLQGVSNRSRDQRSCWKTARLTAGRAGCCFGMSPWMKTRRPFGCAVSFRIPTSCCCRECLFAVASKWELSRRPSPFRSALSRGILTARRACLSSTRRTRWKNGRLIQPR